MNVDYSTVFSLAPFVNENIVTIIGICLLIGAMAKSSQVGLHVWLPMAMEGPTPVSALIHAATMVTAGVYLLMRSSPLIEYSSRVLLLCLWLGAITTVFSSLIGLFQQDIKKVIAYSTMSQLAREFFKFRHQTVCEKTIKIVIYIKICSIKIQRFIIHFLFFLYYVLFSLNTKANFIKKPLYIQHLNYTVENLNPYYVTGFVDGEGCFLINVKTTSALKLGYSVHLTFKIKIHYRDIKLLEKILNYFDKVGNITIRKDGYIELIVSSLKDIKILINHFDTYPLITNKWSDYQIFKEVFVLINNKQHLSIEGFKKILSLKAVFNKGLPYQLKATFSGISPTIRPKTPLPEIKSPYWISGFVDAEGCFFVRLSNTLTTASLVFKVTQNIRDAKLLELLVNYFHCGYYKLCSKMAGDFVVTKFNHIHTIIIPFFKKYPIIGSKYLDFNDFVKVAELIQKKGHKTQGIEQIKNIKSGINKNRYINVNSHIASLSNKSKKTSSFYDHSNDKKYYSTLVTSPYVYLGEKSYNSGLSWSNKPVFFNDKSFNEWLGGIIDGKGQFLVSKKGYASFKLILPEKDKSIFYEIKHKYGGSIKSISGSNSFRYKLHTKKGLINLVNSINGLVRNPAKILQLNKTCVLYNIELKPTIPLTYNNGWFSGIIDADGSLNLNKESDQLILSITQKNRFILDPLNKLYLGRIKIISSKEGFVYSIYRKNEILNLLDNYFCKYPLISSKSDKLKIIKDFYSEYKKSSIPDKWDKWMKFKNQWDKL